MRILTLSAITLIMLASPAMSQDACEIQRRLQQLDLYEGEITCHIGEQTEAAIRRFQERKGLHVDGIAGEDTLRVLFGEGEEERKAPAPVIERRRELSDQERFARCADDPISATVQRGWHSRGINGAIKAWEAEARKQVSLEHGQWINAIKKKADCVPTGVLSVVVCTAVGTPCKAGE
jgi:hypothetical protein